MATSAVFLEGWDTSAFFGMVVVRKKNIIGKQNAFL